jgi:hypothetical protein
MNAPYMHGENVMVPINKLPEGDVKEFTVAIIGHSETGHHHVLTSKQPFKVLEVDDRMYVETMFDALLTHKKTQDKHDTLTIKPGIWEIKHKKEYNPLTKVLQRVFD